VRLVLAPPARVAVAGETLYDAPHPGLDDAASSDTLLLPRFVTVACCVRVWPEPDGMVPKPVVTGPSTT
jgi:hypothetical protein